jgi:hypothetical protein
MGGKERTRRSKEAPTEQACIRGTLRKTLKAPAAGRKMVPFPGSERHPKPMVTDTPPRKSDLDAFRESDRIKTLDIPNNALLPEFAKAIESAMNAQQTPKVRTACAGFLKAASQFYDVPECTVRVLASRPLRVREHWTTELFGDYAPDSKVIRVWMRTAVRKEITSFGTFLSTLCHEFCHHLDFQKFGFADSWHTRGFYERAAVLYHHARGTPQKRLVWAAMAGGRWRIDWPKTNRRSA